MPHPSRSVLSVNALRFALPDGRQLFDIPNFGIAEERVGLIGPNGAGKSTLLRLLVGELRANTGRIVRPVTMGYLRQAAADEAAQTVAQAFGVSESWELHARARDSLVRLGLADISWDRTVRTLSGGERTRLAIAVQVARDPDLLILDEPTNNLDTAARAVVQRLVREWPRGLLVASHDRTLIEAVDRIVLLENGALREYGGNWFAYAEQRATERAALERERDNADAERTRIARHLRDVRERQARRDATGKRSRDTGSQPRNVLNSRRQRAQATTGRVGMVTARLLAHATTRVEAARAPLAERDRLTMTLPSSGLARGTTVVALRDAAIGPSPACPTQQNVSLEIVGPERIALTGRNGAGKTTLLRVLAGDLAPISGHLHRGVPLHELAYLDQHLSLLHTHGTVRDAFAARHPLANRNAMHAALARFRFRARAAEQSVATLSGGERLRAALACLLGGNIVPRALLLDEPTNHLDIEHLEAIEDALLGYDGALVVVSHDTRFLEAVRTERVIAL
jgi:ATPase subunit of ABC transporter with duplicated ATPase domains